MTCDSSDELHQCILSLEGQLTATVYASNDEVVGHSELINSLQDKVGRIIFKGLPTGVEVCPSMQHGGPFPASTDGRFTSVGTDAIKRFVRPVSFQGWPQQALPEALQDGNPLSIWRKVDGEFGKH